MGKKKSTKKTVTKLKTTGEYIFQAVKGKLKESKNYGDKEVNKSINSNYLLNLSLAVCGKLPDVYWTANLTGVELRILKYVHENLLYLYTHLKECPRGQDGTPRFWRGKQRMANDCDMSDTAFRKAVRHLSELGYVTSMDSEGEGEFSGYCIGLSLDFLGKETLDKFFKLNVYDKYDLLARKLYTVDTLGYMLANTPDIVLPDHFMLSDSPQYKEKSRRWAEAMKETDSIATARIAILNIERDAIEAKKTKSEKVLESAKKAWLAMRDNVFPEDIPVLNLKRYYNVCSRVAERTDFFNILRLDDNWRDKPSWRWLKKIYAVCKDNNFDYEVYVDAQFDRVKWFKNKQVRPYLNQMYSPGAIQYYHQYVTNIKQTLSLTGKIKVKPKQNKEMTFTTFAVDKMFTDCEKIRDWMKKAHKYPAFKNCSPEELKSIYIAQDWSRLSTYYLATCPQFIKLVDSMPQDVETYRKLKEELQVILSKKSMIDQLNEIVPRVESEVGIPVGFQVMRAG